MVDLVLLQIDPVIFTKRKINKYPVMSKSTLKLDLIGYLHDQHVAISTKIQSKATYTVLVVQY